MTHVIFIWFVENFYHFFFKKKNNKKKHVLPKHAINCNLYFSLHLSLQNGGSMVMGPLV